MLRSVHQTPLSLWWFATDDSGGRERQRDREGSDAQWMRKLNRERERERRDGGRCRKGEGVCCRETGCLDGVECVLLCGRLSDCNDCSKVTGLISGRAAQSGTITVQILWMKSERLRSSLCAWLQPPLESGLYYASLFFTLFVDIIARLKKRLHRAISSVWGLTPS